MTIKVSTQFKKSMKKVKQNPRFKKKKFDDILTMIMEKQPFPQSIKFHKVSPSSPKELQGMNIVHVAPNICLIYKVEDDVLYLYDIGSHNDTELTETF